MKRRVTPEGLKVLESLFDEVRLLFHTLKAAANDLHCDTGITASMRGVLEGLLRMGPQTVPAMARARPVSRQHIQIVVNELLRQKLVETQENPAHKGSLLIALTKKGVAQIRQMKEREQRLLMQCKLPVSEKNLTGAAETLRAVRGLFNSREWKEAIHGSQ
jgi:DNA-binding MarR family transcriptional regulator